MLPEVILTTDGAARGNPGPGGWAALLEGNGRERLLSGEGPARTTNNAMELYAATAGLEALNHPCRVLLRLDSRYVLDGLQRLLDGGKLPEKNRELWQRLLTAARPHTLTFEWVRGHAGDPRNERVDKAANAASNRAFRMDEQARDDSGGAANWTLALRSPSAQRPVEWALHTPSARRVGQVAVRGVTQPTAVYHALVQGMTAASELPDAAAVALHVLSNYELIVKQGRGEWRVKQAEQQALARQVAALRSQFASLRFEYATTEQVQALLDEEARG